MNGQVGISTIPLRPGMGENCGMDAKEKIPQRDVFRQRLRQRLDELPDVSARSASIAIGANQGYVRDLLDPIKTSMPSAERARALAATLQTTTDWLFGLADTHDPVVSEVSVIPARPEWRDTRGEKLPVFGTGYCDDLEVESDGRLMQIEQTLFDPTNTVTMIERPPALRHTRDAYAIFFHGSSMEPRFFQGEIGIVTPTPPPGPGDFVVVQLNDGEGDDVVHVLVKRLIRATSAYVELEQFLPAMTFRIDRKRVARMHKILGPNHLYTV